MADRTDLDFTYSLTDRIIRLSLGELPDFSGAMFDGDFALSLEQAQRRKHEYVRRNRWGSGRGGASWVAAGVRCWPTPGRAVVSGWG